MSQPIGPGRTGAGTRDQSSPVVALVGTLDTKGAEYEFLRERITEQGASAIMIDVGVLGEPGAAATFDRHRVAELGGDDLARLRRVADRSAGMTVMARGAARVVADLVEQSAVDAVIAVGGSNAAYVTAEVCAQLPIGFPKMLVSTIAAGDTRAYVRQADLTLVYPVVDINGLNRVTRPILGNAVNACVGMAAAHRHAVGQGNRTDEPSLVGVTMFGVTTACGSAVVHGVEGHGFEALTFHCTGVGGATLESLIRSGIIDAVADLTTTELADDLVGGVCSAGPDRLTAAALNGTPQVVSVGALDMVNFSGPDTVPEKFSGRNLHAHNPAVTLMRTSAAECAELGARLATKLNPSTAPVAVLFPHRGLSQLSVPGGPFADPDADHALYESLRAGLRPDICIHDLDTDINDPAVSATAVELLTTWLDKEMR